METNVVYWGYIGVIFEIMEKKLKLPLGKCQKIRETT